MSVVWGGGRETAKKVIIGADSLKIKAGDIEVETNGSH